MEIERLHSCYDELGMMIRINLLIEANKKLEDRVKVLELEMQLMSSSVKKFQSE